MKRYFQRRWKIFAALWLAGMTVVCGVAWWVGDKESAPMNHAIAEANDLKVERVTFSSMSGATIHGWLVTPATNLGVVVLQHGLHGSRRSMQARAKFLSQAGYAVLLFDFQGHGESIGKVITMGYLESRDSQAAVTFAKSRFPGKPVAVIGVSLGAAAAVLTEPPLPVQALVLESMYPTIEDATKDRIEMVLGPGARWLYPLLTGQIWLRSGGSASDLRPIEHVGKITTPKLFLAGTEDQGTKFEESKAIFAQAAEPKTFVPFEGAHHQDLHTFARKRYEELILNFLKEHMK
jgi:alpha-beta hydrolase superfamily lysophospholipase